MGELLWGLSTNWRRTVEAPSMGTFLLSASRVCPIGWLTMIPGRLTDGIRRATIVPIYHSDVPSTPNAVSLLDGWYGTSSRE